MSRKVYVEVKVKLILDMEENGYTAGHVVNEMDYSFTSNTPGVAILDKEIIDYEVMNSK